MMMQTQPTLIVATLKDMDKGAQESRLCRAAVDGLCRSIDKHANAIRYALTTSDTIREDSLADLATAVRDLDDVLATIRSEPANA